MSLRLALALFLLVPLIAGAQVRISNTIQDLRTLTAPSLTSTNVDVLGYYAPGDWGEKRRFVLTPTNPGQTNRGNIFTSLIDTNRFWIADDRFALRQDVRWWGPTVSPPTAEVAINAAAKWLTNGVIDFPSGYFRAGALIDITNNVVLEGNGFETFLDMQYNGVTLNDPSLRFYGRIGDPFPMMTAAPAGTNKVCSDQDFGLVAGDLIMLHNPANNSYGGHRVYYHSGQFAEVLEIVAVTNIYLKSQIWENLPATGVNIHKMSPIRAGVKDMKLGFPTDTSGLQVIYAQDFTLSGVNGFGSSYAQVQFSNCYRIEMPDNFLDWDSDPIVGLNYGVFFGGCEFVNVRGGLYRAGRHGSTSGASPTDYKIPNRFLRFLGTTVDSTREEQFGADFHGNAWGCSFVNCDLPKGVDIGGNEIDIIDCRISNPNTAQAIFSQELLGTSIRIRGNKFRIRNGATAGNTWGMRLFYRGGIGDYAGTDTNNWAGTKPNPGGQWLQIQNNTFEFLNPITSSTYLILIDEAASLSSNTNAVKAVFGGVRVTGNVVSVPNSQVYANGYGDTAALFLYGRTNMFWREWEVNGNHFANLAFRGNLGARDVRVSENTWTNVLNATGSIYLIPGDVQYGVADVRTWRNTIRGANGSGIYMADVAGTFESTGDFFEDWFGFTSGYGITVLYTDAAHSNVTTRVTLKENAYNSTQVGVTAANYITALAAHGVKRDEVFQGFAVDGGTFTVASSDIQKRTTNYVGISNPLEIGKKTTAQLAALTNIPDNTFATDINLNKLMKSFGGSWYDIIPTNFSTLTISGQFNAKDIVARTLTTTPAWTVSTAPIADPYNPIYSFNSVSNLTASWHIQNGSSGDSAAARLLLSAIGGTAALTDYQSNSVAYPGRLVLGSTTGILPTSAGLTVLDSVIGVPVGTNFLYLYDLESSGVTIDAGLPANQAAVIRLEEIRNYVTGSASYSDTGVPVTVWTITESVQNSGNTTLILTLTNVTTAITPGSFGQVQFLSWTNLTDSGTWQSRGVQTGPASFHQREATITGPFGVPPAAGKGGVTLQVTGTAGTIDLEISSTNQLSISITNLTVNTPETYLRSPTNTLVYLLGLSSDATTTARRIIASTLANAGSAAGFITDAPSDGTPYGRQSGAWTGLNALFGRLVATNYWTGASNIFTGATYFTGELLSPGSGPGNTFKAGKSAVASDTNAIAIGLNSAASKTDALAAGVGATASALFTTAVGFGTSAAFDYSSAFGQGAASTTTNQIALGTLNDTVYVPGVLKVGTTNVVEALSLKVNDAPSDSVYYGRRNAAWTDLDVRYGRLGSANSWTDANDFAGALTSPGSGGVDSFKAGSSAVASGTYAVAIGSSAIASGDLSTAYGGAASASTRQSTALGYFADTSASNSVAVGFTSLASGTNSIAIGYLAQAQAARSVAIGQRALAASVGEIALGTAAEYVKVYGGLTVGLTNIISELALKAPLASPVFTGDPTAPTPAWGVASDNDTSIATTAFVAGVNGTRAGFRYWDDLLCPETTRGDRGTIGVNNSGSVNIMTAEAGRPGAKFLRTSAENQGPLFGWYQTISLLGPASASAVDQYYFEACVKTPIHLSGQGATNEYAIQVGFNSVLSGTNAPGDGVYLTHQTNIIGNQNWVFQTSSNSVAATAVDTGSAVAINTWYRLGLYLDATNAIAYINGSAVATNTLRLPLNRTFGASVRFARFGGTTTLDVPIDWEMIDWRGATR